MAREANRVRLVPVNRRPYDEMDALVERHGWTEDEGSESDAATQWRVPGCDAVVRWNEDGDTGVHFFVVEGPDRDRVARQIEDEIEMLEKSDFEAYLERFRGTDGLMRGLYSVAAAAPEAADSGVISLFRKYFRHEDPLIRRVAALAVSITGWPEWAEPVGELRDDPDEAVREAAEATLGTLSGP
jgi:hypothetical protein